MAVRGISHRPSPPDWNYPVSETPLLSVITITSPLQKNLQENSAVKYTAFLLTGMHLPVPKPKQIYSFMYNLSKGEKRNFKISEKDNLKTLFVRHLWLRSRLWCHASFHCAVKLLCFQTALFHCLSGTKPVPGLWESVQIHIQRHTFFQKRKPS